MPSSLPSHRPPHTWRSPRPGAAGGPRAALHLNVPSSGLRNSQLAPANRHRVLCRWSLLTGHDHSHVYSFYTTLKPSTLLITYSTSTQRNRSMQPLPTLRRARTLGRRLVESRASSSGPEPSSLVLVLVHLVVLVRRLVEFSSSVSSMLGSWRAGPAAESARRQCRRRRCAGGPAAELPGTCRPSR